MKKTTSSKAEDRKLGEWYTEIQRGNIKLPRFQRHGDAWDKSKIRNLIQTIIDNLPVGVTLILNVEGDEKFKSKHIYTAPKFTKIPREHLLDGQQRLTSIWRAFNNNFEKETYSIYLPEFDTTKNTDQILPEVVIEPRYTKKDGVKYPLWIDKPDECLKRGVIPLDLFRPEIIEQEIEDWLTQALGTPEQKGIEEVNQYYQTKEKIKKYIGDIRVIIQHFNLPFLSLPADTEKDVALSVFINMNTNSKPLQVYDIIVAQVEQEKEQSLHELQSNLHEKYPKISKYSDLGQLILATSALMQDKAPNNKGMLEMNLTKMIENWNLMEESLHDMALFLEGQKIYDDQRLPTNAILAVIASCFSLSRLKGDKLGQLEFLLKQYMWSSFFTDRYENSAASRAHADYLALKNIILGESTETSSVPVINRKSHPLITKDEILDSGWPKNRDITARGILAISTYLGANDIADGQAISGSNIEKRQYHHIFPQALLEKFNIDSKRQNLVLNCALLSGFTNQHIGAKTPYEYIEDRIKNFDKATIDQRLNSHLIPTRELAIRNDDIISAYELFLETRAIYVYEAVLCLSEGKEITYHTILTPEQETQIDIKELLSQNESKHLEYKSSLHYCLKEHKKNKDLQESVIKTIAGLLNTDGGYLLIGVEETKEGNKVIGLENDFSTFSSDNKIDAFKKHYDNIISNALGNAVFAKSNLSLHEVENKTIGVVHVLGRSTKPIFVRNTDFYVRRSASTVSLNAKETQDYISDNWL